MHGKFKFPPDDVFPLMREAMWWSGKCKFSLKDVFSDAGSHVVAWEM